MAADLPTPAHPDLTHQLTYARIHLADASPRRVLKWVESTFGDRSGLSCSFGGPGGIVLAHMVSRWSPSIPLLFVDTGFLFPETYALKEKLEREWNLQVYTRHPKLTPAEQERKYKERLWEDDPDMCCHLRKVQPMLALLKGKTCWITALRRDQSTTRASTQRFELHQLESGEQLLKVNPLVDWDRSTIWRYILEHELPYNPLLDQGYTSLGCTHCTVRSSGTDEREGRWQGISKTECGLHTFTRLEASSGVKPPYR